MSSNTVEYFCSMALRLWMVDLKRSWSRKIVPHTSNCLSSNVRDKNTIITLWTRNRDRGDTPSWAGCPCPQQGPIFCRLSFPLDIVGYWTPSFGEVSTPSSCHTIPSMSCEPRWKGREKAVRFRRRYSFPPDHYTSRTLSLRLPCKVHLRWVFIQYETTNLASHRSAASLLIQSSSRPRNRYDPSVCFSNRSPEWKFPSADNRCGFGIWGESPSRMNSNSWADESSAWVMSVKGSNL
jgi:hypothetical protein